MAKTKLPYGEGTWFAVPLRTGGYAVGVVARMAGDGRTFGYFFGPERQSVPSQDEISRLRPDEAVWLARFGDLGLLRGEWPIISRDLPWNRQNWPLPPFIRVDDIAQKAWKAVYSDDLTPESDEPCDASLASQYPEDAGYGYGAVEIRLTKLLDKTA